MSYPRQATIEFSREYSGKPIILPGVNKNPYADLEEASGYTSEHHADLRRVAGITAQMQDLALGATILLPELSVHAGVIAEDMGKILPTAVREMSGRRSGLFYLMDQKGETVFAGHTESPQLIFQGMGSFTPDIHDRLSMQRERLGSITNRQLQTTLNVIDCPEGGLVIETGAGKDYARIKALNDHARTRSGLVVCHDIPPAASRAAKNNTDGVPYIALPGRVEFLAAPFVDVDRPKIITLKDTLTSMAPSTIQHLLEVAATVNAQKVIATQALGIGAKTHSPFMPQGLSPTDKQFSSLMVNFLLMEGRDAAPIMEDFFLRYVLTGSVSDNTYAIMMELIRNVFIDYAKEHTALKHSNTYVVEDSEILENAKALDYILELHPEALSYFLTGTFNCVTFGPFAPAYSKVDGVESGALKVVGVEMHTEISQRALNPGRVKPASEHQSMKVLGPKGLIKDISPRNGIPLAAIMACDELAPGADTNPKPAIIEKARALGAKIAAKIVFDVYGRQARLPNVVPAIQSGFEKTVREKYAR